MVTVKPRVLEVLAVSSASVAGAKTAVSGFEPAVVSAVVTKVAIPEFTLTALPIATPLFLKVTVPAAAAGERVAVRVTLEPDGAVVTTVFGAAVSAAVSAVVVVACETVTVLEPEGDVEKSAGTVGVKVAVRTLAPISRDVVASVAVPELTATGLPTVAVPFLNVTVPAAEEGETDADSVTLAPKAAVVMAVAGADVSPTASVVVAVACVTLTLVAGVEVLAAKSVVVA